MTPNWRKPFGVLAILALVAAWCAIVASAAQSIGSLHWALQLAIYAVAGTIWVVPLGPMLRWMESDSAK